MKIAVAGVEDVANLKAVFFADLVDFAQSGWKFSARDHAVLHVVGGRKAADGAESVLAPFPEQVALRRVAGDANFARVMHTADFGDVFGMLLGGFFYPVDFEQQNRGTIERESSVHVG